MSAQPDHAPVTPHAPAPAAPAELLAQLRADRRAERWVPAFKQEWTAALEESRRTFSLAGLYEVVQVSRPGHAAAPAGAPSLACASLRSGISPMLRGLPRPRLHHHWSCADRSESADCGGGTRTNRQPAPCAARRVPARVLVGNCGVSQPGPRAPVPGCCPCSRSPPACAAGSSSTPATTHVPSASTSPRYVPPPPPATTKPAPTPSPSWRSRSTPRATPGSPTPFHHSGFTLGELLDPPPGGY
ncbi:DUF6247 family protein [Streptomyces sp. NPDC001858]